MKKMNLQQVIANLPFHDADLISINIHTSSVGETHLAMNIQIDPEESLRPFIEIGIESNVINLHFEKCWKILSSLLYYNPRREQIFDWKVSSDSEKLILFRKQCVPPSIQLLHHEFEFSGGSTFEVMSEKAFIENAVNPNVQRYRLE